MKVILGTACIIYKAVDKLVTGRDRPVQHRREIKKKLRIGQVFKGG